MRIWLFKNRSPFTYTISIIMQSFCSTTSGLRTIIQFGLADNFMKFKVFMTKEQLHKFYNSCILGWRVIKEFGNTIIYIVQSATMVHNLTNDGASVAKTLKSDPWKSHAHYSLLYPPTLILIENRSNYEN